MSAYRHLRVARAAGGHVVTVPLDRPRPIPGAAAPINREQRTPRFKGR